MRPFNNSHPSSGKNKYYRPLATRTATLIILFVATLLLIALLEYSCHMIPQHSGFGSTAEELVNITRSKLDERDAYIHQKRAEEANVSNEISPSTSVDSAASSSLATTVTPIPSSGKSTTHTVSLTGTGSSGVTSKATTTIPMPTLSSATYLTPDKSTPVDSFAPDSTYLSPGKGITSTTDGSYMTPGSTNSYPTIAFSTSAPGMIISNTKSTTPSPTVVPVTSEYVSTITVSQPITVSITSDYVSPISIPNPTTAGKGTSPSNQDTAVNKTPVTSMQQVSDSTTIEVVTFTSSSRDPDGTLVELIITSSSLVRTVPSTSNRLQNVPTRDNPISAPTATVTNDSSMLVIVSTFKSVYESTIFSTSSGTTVDRPVATSANSSGTFVYYSSGAVTAPDQITYRQYLTASFLPLFLAIFYAIPWRILENTVRNMEPFYQLRPFSHSTESEAIRIDYESPSIFILPFKSLPRRHFTIFVTSLISIIMLAVAPLASQVMIIVESNYCVGTGFDTCDSWGIYPNFARLLEGLLGSIAVFTLFLIFAGLRRDSGVYSEPLSLVGLAVIHRKTPLSLQAINNSQTRLEEEETRIPAQGYTFLMAAEGEIASATQDSALLRSKRREDSRNTFLSKVLKGIRARVLHICMLCLLCGILVVVAVYYQTNANTGFNRFMNSQGFGVRFFMTALGTGTNLLWSRVDDDFRKTDPYHQLLRGNAKPQNSILAPVHMSPYSALIPSIGRKHYLVSWISFCSILSEFLPITLANIPFSNTETRLVLLTCFYLAMAILSLMIIGVVLLLLRSRHGVKSLPKKPFTIAARLQYLDPTGEVDDSNLLRSLDGLASFEREERDARVISRGKLYSMGTGEDGKLRIDEDERIVGKWRKENRDSEDV
ncbi:uncharacterized protein EAE97_000442 [Botrytis byssoidea]|uniref:Uncharacterized protein n=1 Tax=Botrytis byssoidea TaxID=139641 RepID=A0A9P5M4B5_9HELO|nr:uncharacterized protein EAE97_000442 [Botrytis byssoidea]KAF7955183.1 hypothetical protein EAE97_000442 [Botrytis byssoidea]